MEHKPIKLAELIPADEEQLFALYNEAKGTAPKPQFTLKERGPLLIGLLLFSLIAIPFIGLAAIPFFIFVLTLIMVIMIALDQRHSPAPHPRDQSKSHVLATVAKYLMREPLEQSKRILLSIEHSIVRLNRSLTKIEPTVRALEEFVENASTEETKLLFSSRLARAGDVRTRLYELRDELIGQKAHAEEVVRPMQRVLDELKKLDALDRQIETIAQAHNVASEAERESDAYTLRLKSLKSAAIETDGRLQEIAVRLGPALENVKALELSAERLVLKHDATMTDRLKHLSESNKH